MNTKFLPTILFVAAFTLFIISQPTKAFSIASHVVISEIQVGPTGDTNNEFIELYNPTDASVNLNGWSLKRKTAAGAEDSLVATLSGTLTAHSYFLIGSPEYNSTPSADISYSTDDHHVSTNNTVLLYSDSGTTVVDKIGFGSGVLDFEGALKGNPPATGSIERKASSTSTIASMIIGGIDEFLGNGEDTDNNLNDFINRAIPQPQNSSSTAEPITNSPTLTPTGSVTVTPTNTNTPTPTNTGTPTSTPSASPTSTITATATPTGTITVTNTPTVTITGSITPTLTLTPTATPSVTATPTPTGRPSHVLGVWNFPTSRLTCSMVYTPRNFGFLIIFIPRMVCERTSL